MLVMGSLLTQVRRMPRKGSDQPDVKSFLETHYLRKEKCETPPFLINHEYIKIHM